MSKIFSTNEVSPVQLAATAKGLTEANIPIFVWGPPAIGKSSIMQQVADTSSRIFLDWRALLLDPVDLNGVPWRDSPEMRLFFTHLLKVLAADPERKAILAAEAATAFTAAPEQNVTRWASPEFLPRETGTGDKPGRWLLCIDELPAAPLQIQTALYSLILDRRIGEYRLPAGVAIVACGNRQTDGGAYHRMPMALRSRFLHYDLVPDLDQWMTWANTNHLASEVVTFLKFKRDAFHVYDPKSDEHTFPAPRTWERVSDVVLRSGLDSTLMRFAVKAAVGNNAGGEFCAFLEVWRDLPTPDEIIADPNGAKMPEGMSAQIALAGSLASVAEKDNFEAIITFTKRLRLELGTYLVRSARERNPPLQYTRSYAEWQVHRSNADRGIGMGSN